VRSHVIDEIGPKDMEKIIHYLDQKALHSTMKSIYWKEIPEDLYSKRQGEHKDCAPYAFAIELGADWIKLEFFVRSMAHLRCECQDYCTPRQRAFVLGFADRIIGECGIRT